MNKKDLTLSMDKIELAFRGHNIHLGPAIKEDITRTIIEYVRPIIEKQEREAMDTWVKDDYEIAMESMEDVLDFLEDYTEKVTEGIEKLTSSCKVMEGFKEEVEKLRENIKDKWRGSL